MSWLYSAPPELSDEEFQEWLQLLEDRTGISFEKHKQILQTGLVQRMQEIDVQSYRDYYHVVTFKNGWALEWAALLRTLTVKETRFLRDPDALEFLKKHLFRLLSSNKHQGSLNIWSVASSTGEEPYTLAMVANDCIEGLKAEKYFGVTATDICLSSLSIARKGIYPNRRLDYMDKRLRERYFEDIGHNKSAVVKWLKDRVCFVQGNIIDLGDLPVNNMDVVYCQNVLIYFKKWRQKAVLDELVERLKPEGLLVVGMGEAVGWSNPKVTRVKDDSVQAYIKVA
jgi:type IV pilus assembly protein PilK